MLIGHYWKAYKGYQIWNKIDKEYHAPIYILMPKEKDEYNYYALLHLEQFLKKRKITEAVILTCDEEAIAATEVFISDYKVNAKYISRQEALALIKYYSLCEFTSKLVIVSFTEPYDTYSEHLLGVHGVTKEELVCFDIYRLGVKPTAAPIKYTGKNPKILAFFERCEKK